jgi:hypothetical protein
MRWPNGDAHTRGGEKRRREGSKVGGDTDHLAQVDNVKGAKCCRLVVVLDFNVTYVHRLEGLLLSLFQP